ncbi:hypothetical protein EGW08_004776 [Elysia chlorotica]|uniref:Laminin G domain-containing protein n=1 Tax=Elysia chlorotica TaxID=188477 RepID=A0A433U0Y0_ELYCH|nr:hypothetical protein EGW08_004776 [Elysia chlorotica]
MKSTRFITAVFLTFFLAKVWALGEEITEASFYGESYVHSAFQDAKQSFSVNLEFQTARPDGLLFLAAGNTDYLLVQLNAGIIETRLNLGSGEAIVFSARGVRLDDTKWHKLEITCNQGVLYLMIDGKDQGQSTTPGNFYDLNIELGVYLGSRGNLKTTFFRGNMMPFRGCLRKVIFNERNILVDAQNAVFVTWSCDEEFTARSDSVISMNNKTSFLALPSFRIYPGSTGILSCDVKTRSSDALVFFNSGQGSTSRDFVAVELINGKPKLSIDMGSGLIEVTLQTSINDGTWHTLMVEISETSAKLQMDAVQNSTRFHLGGQNYLNLGHHLYIGGLGSEAQSLISKLTLPSVTEMLFSRTSLIGCVRNIAMNSAKYGFQEIQMSRYIGVDCMWKFPCSLSPCIETASCLEVGMDEFRCECNEASCVKSGFEQRASTADDHIHSILSVRELLVPQGGNVVIDENTIHVQDEYINYFMQKNVVFQVKSQPKMGKIEVYQRAEVQSFTWSDLTRESVYYHHSGGQSGVDEIGLEISVSLSPFRSETTKTYDFMVPVRVASKTHFQVKAPSGYVLPVSSGGRIQITTDILNIESDTDPSMFIFQVVFLRRAESYFEKITSPANPLTVFTFEDIRRGYIWFQHEKDAMVYTKITVTDNDVTESVQLRFRRQDIEVKMARNTGLRMSYGSNSLISSQNLSFVAGSELEDKKVRYEIVQLPQHGVIQFYSDTSKWIDVRNFTQEDIDSGKIRYQHFPDDSFSKVDSFKFRVIQSDRTTEDETFRIRFENVVMTVERNSELIIHKDSYSRFSNTTLLVLSNADNLDGSNIVYSVAREPSKGKLYFTKRPISSLFDFDLEPPLREDDKFSQMDVNNGFVYYKYNNPSISKATDYLDLEASYFGYTIMVRTLVVFSPGNLGVRLVNKGLEGVIEGGLKVLSTQNLYIEAEKYKNFTFFITEGPSHGSLCIVDSKTLVVLNPKISSFITAQLVSGRVAYKHDDSENKNDLFKFVATPNVKESSNLPAEIEQLTGMFHISIRMRNDNPPVRITNKVFHVVTGQVKTLSIHDLAFHDPDIDFDDSRLVYQRHTISNGDILDKKTEENIFNFTQKDLMDERLMFHHKGESVSRVPLLVTDGQFFSNSILEIQASQPFVRIVGTLVLQVESGQTVILDKENIAVESNLDFKPEDVTIRLSTTPKYGTLQVNGNINAAFSFNDVLNRKVKYQHWGQNVLSDTINLIVIVDAFTTNAQLTVEVTSLDMAGPPEIVHNQVCSVNSGQIQVITNQHLEARHKGYLPRDINYIVTNLPQHGHLVIKGRPAKEGSAPEFSQEDIDNGHVVYASDSTTHLTDKFTFDVGTDGESLRDMEFLIEVVPQTAITTHVSATILEGGRFTFNTSLFSQFNLISGEGGVSFIVEQAPMHGKIILQIGSEERHIQTFSAEDLQRKRVLYVHDDSESQSDIVAIKAKPEKSESHPGEILLVKIAVSPVDDQPPRIIVNSGLSLWSGSLTLLTGRHLEALDPDTSSSGIQYMVTDGPSNGHISFLSNHFKPITSFTQLDLDSEQVIFVHKGAVSGSFTVRVSDGKNQGESVTVNVRASLVTITVPNLKKLDAFPGHVQPITSQTLLAEVSASNFSDPIIFTLISPRPRKGRLVTRSYQHIIEIKSFTQDEVNQGKVFYQHTDLMLNWQEADRLVFDVSTTYAQTLRNKVLDVSIAFSNINGNNYRDLLKIKTPEVKEGDQVFIDRENFDSSKFVSTLQRFYPEASVHFSFESFARYGWLWYKDAEFELGQEFTQEDLNSRLLVYKHDDSDSTRDTFLFGMKILVPRAHGESDRSIGGLLFNFSLIIEPVNDNAYLLLTLHPKISVLQGSEIAVTSVNLTTADLDTGPGDIEYIIETQPTNGMLVLTTAPTSRLRTFTQLDIDKLNLVFKHDGSSQSRSSVYFKVWDKKFPPTYANLDIEVRPLAIDVDTKDDIPIYQGTTAITLTPQHLKVTTNGDHAKLIYQIVKKPRYGRFTKDSRPTSGFTQQDLEQRRIQYVQNPDSQGTDIFEMKIRLGNLDVSRSEVEYFIMQKPLVKQGPLLAVDGDYVALTRASLDASELAQLTGDNPKFNIAEGPNYGKIMRRQRQRREAGIESSFTPVSEFTFEDVIFTRIYYVPDKVTRASQDKITYSLSAKGVPAAYGELIIDLNEEETIVDTDRSTTVTNKDITPTVSRSSNVDEKVGGSERSKDNAGDGKFPDEPKEETKSVEQKPSMDSNTEGDNMTIIIIAIVLILCLVLVAVAIVVLVLRKRRARERAKRNLKPAAKPRPLISGPLQLEQPHVLIQPKTGGIGDQDNSTSAPLIPSPVDSQAGEHIALVSSSAMFDEGKPAPETDDHYVNTAHAKDHALSHRAPQHNAASPDVTQVASGSRPRPESESAVSEDAGEHGSTITSGRGSSATSDLIDWSLMDPDLLQSCNLATPALRSNQYWL